MGEKIFEELGDLGFESDCGLRVRQITGIGLETPVTEQVVPLGVYFSVNSE